MSDTPKFSQAQPGDYYKAILQDGRILEVGKAWPHVTSKGIVFDPFLLVGHIDVEGPEGTEGEIAPPHAEKLVVRSMLNPAKAGESNHPWKRNGQLVIPTIEVAIYPFVTSLESLELASENAREIDEMRDPSTAKDAPESP